MPYDLPFTLEEVQASLQKPKSSRVSRQLPHQRVELVSNAYDRSAPYLCLDVQGFTPEDHEHLSGGFYAALQAKQRLEALAEQTRQEHNPQGTPAGAILAEAEVRTRIKPYLTKASAALYAAAQEVLKFGVVGWPEGELLHKGAPLGFASAPSTLLGKRRDGLSGECLNYLLATPFWMLACVAVLEVSGGSPWPSAEDQWQRAEEQAYTAVGDFLQWASGESRNRPFFEGSDPP